MQIWPHGRSSSFHHHPVAVLPPPYGEPRQYTHSPHSTVHWPGQHPLSLPAPNGGQLRSNSAILCSLIRRLYPLWSIKNLNCRKRHLLTKKRESDVCSSEVNFYFLADRTCTPMLLPAPFILPKQRQPSPKGAMAKGVGSHFTFQAGGVGGLGMLPPQTFASKRP